jgi:hypothetical protein
MNNIIDYNLDGIKKLLLMFKNYNISKKDFYFYIRIYKDFKLVTIDKMFSNVSILLQSDLIVNEKLVFPIGYIDGTPIYGNESFYHPKYGMCEFFNRDMVPDVVTKGNYVLHTKGAFITLTDEAMITLCKESSLQPTITYKEKINVTEHINSGMEDILKQCLNNTPINISLFWFLNEITALGEVIKLHSDLITIGHYLETCNITFDITLSFLNRISAKYGIEVIYDYLDVTGYHHTLIKHNVGIYNVCIKGGIGG